MPRGAELVRGGAYWFGRSPGGYTALARMPGHDDVTRTGERTENVTDPLRFPDALTELDGKDRATPIVTA